ncbi:hypothetical protein PAXINDRAFT_46654, partial [Paxillus involutus ATCC 200175]
GHSSEVRSVAFLSDGKQVISGSEGLSRVRTWMVKDGREARVGRVMGEKSVVTAVATSNDGQWIATANGSRPGDAHSNRVTIWKATTHRKVVELEGHSAQVQSLAFSPDSARVVSGSWDGMVLVWSTTGERLIAHEDFVKSVAVSHNGNFIVSGSRDYKVRIWDMATSTQIGSTLQHNDWVNSVAISPDGSYLATGGVEKKVYIWSLK